MNTKRTLAVTIFGWFLIAVSLVFLISFPKTLSAISNYHKMFDFAPIGAGAEGGIGFFERIFIQSIIHTSVGFLLFFIAGIGVLKLKRWAYYLALAMPFLYFMAVCKRILAGFQFVINLQTFVEFITAFGMLIFLPNKKISQQFNTQYTTKKGRKINPAKFLALAALAFLVVNIVQAASLFLLSKKYSSIINLKPQKKEYVIEDEAFILNNCQKRDVFGYSIYIPSDWKIGMVSKGESEFGWNISFSDMQDSNIGAIIMLESRSFSGIWSPISKILGFKTVYDFERKINYPAFAPIYLILKSLINASDVKGIDDVSASTWKGFINVVNKNNEKNVYHCSIYSLKNNKTSGILLSFKNGIMTHKQAKSIIASLEFSGADKKSGDLFENGKSDLGKGDFTSAALNFLNAFYINELNSEYAYYLSYSLFQDKSASARKIRMGSSKRFLEYALELKPDYQEAKDLLVLVEEEIKQLQSQSDDGKTDIGLSEDQ